MFTTSLKTIVIQLNGPQEGGAMTGPNAKP